ncbi:MAG: MFS transporter [Arcanobacterium sp.]|nr:MFS transporter [Arcanobacterium sp.]
MYRRRRLEEVKKMNAPLYDNAGKRQRRRSIFIAASGTIVEWFDYSLFFYLATALSQTFYPGMDNSVLLVLATGAVGFLFRPLGAIVFGHIGDTKGRTVALVASAGLMSLAMLGIALMPGYATLGIWGGIGVLALRALAGFSVGAEYTGIMVYLMESASPKRRGLTASWASANSEVGALLAVGSAALTGAIVGTEALNEWAWRIPFGVGALLAAGMIPLRRYMVESPVMHTVQDSSQNTAQASPLRAALQNQRRAVIVSFLISMVGSATYFLTITYLPTYVETVHGQGTQTALNYGVLAAFAAILVTPLFGLASDYFGRRRTFVGILILVLLLAIPGYWLLSSTALWVIALAVVVLAVPAAGWSAVAAAAVPEQFEVRGRYSGMAVGYNLATVIFGGLTPSIVTWLTQTTGDALTPAYYASIIALLGGIPALILLVDRVRPGAKSITPLDQE